MTEIRDCAILGHFRLTLSRLKALKTKDLRDLVFRLFSLCSIFAHPRARVTRVCVWAQARAHAHRKAKVKAKLVVLTGGLRYHADSTRKSRLSHPRAKFGHFPSKPGCDSKLIHFGSLRSRSRALTHAPRRRARCARMCVMHVRSCVRSCDTRGREKAKAKPPTPTSPKGLPPMGFFALIGEIFSADAVGCGSFTTLPKGGRGCRCGEK